MYEVTSTYSNTMQVDQFRIFLNKYLLPAVINNIQKYKKLNYHYYSALKKGLWKPAAFFRGILFPLCRMENVTLKTASIIASVLSSVPFKDFKPLEINSYLPL